MDVFDRLVFYKQQMDILFFMEINKTYNRRPVLVTVSMSVSYL